VRWWLVKVEGTCLGLPNIVSASLSTDWVDARLTCCGLLLAGDAGGDLTTGYQHHDIISDAQHTVAAPAL
jgi:hypothetical protein